MRYFSALFVIFGIAAAIPALAQSADRSSTARDSQPPRNVFNHIESGRLAAEQALASSLIGKPVYTNDDYEFGEVADVVLDTASGRIDQLVVNSNGGLFSKALYGIDWSAVAYNKQRRRVTLALSRDDVMSGDAWQTK